MNYKKEHLKENYVSWLERVIKEIKEDEREYIDKIELS